VFSNYLKIAVRTLFKHKSFSLINILGLSIGMPVCLLVILVVSGQRDLDQFQTNKDRIFRIVTHVTEKSTGNVDDVATAPAPLSPLLQSELSEVENTVRLTLFSATMKHNEKVFTVQGFYAEQSFFDIFSYSLKAGNKEHALDRPFSAVISEELGRKVFGEQNPVGQVLTFPFGDVIVTGVLADLQPHQRSHIQREILLSFSTLLSFRNLNASSDPRNWNAFSSFYHYLLLSDENKASDVERALPRLMEGVFRNDTPLTYECSLQPLTDIAFGRELLNRIGDVMERPVLYIFLIVALVVMAPVIFNYVSLTVARSLKRSKEIGVRKVVGAQRSHIVWQILFESALISLLAIIPSILLLDLLLPVFNDFQFVDYISIDWKFDWRVYAFFLFFSAGLGLIAGIIPAMVLSTVKPALALKGLGRMPGFSGMTLRKVFLVIQFTLSLFFIILTIVFHRQLAFMLSADYGFDKEHIVAVSLQNVPFELFRNEVLPQAGVLDVSASSDLIGRSNPDPGPEVRSPFVAEPIKTVSFSISENHLANLGFELLAGRGFSSKHATDTSQAIIINETALKRLGFRDASAAVGQRVEILENGPKEIVGVTKDFHYARLQNVIDPVILEYHPSEFSYALVRVAPNEMLNVIPSIESVWAKLNDDLTPMRYRFLDEYVLGAYNDMREITVFLSIIAGLAIVISCLGLLGMAIFSTETRTKEIGVRKVFGASSTAIVILLSQDLAKLLAIAVLAATPLLWAFINFMFLERVAFRFELGAGVFLIGFGIVAFSALLTIGSQTIKVANGNPVDALKYE